MTKFEKQKLAKWLKILNRPDLCWFAGLRLRFVKHPRLCWHVYQLGYQHPELDCEEWIARSRARALCERFPYRWFLPFLALLLVCSVPLNAQSIDVIHVQNNGTMAGTLAGPFVLNCTSATAACSITNGPKTLTMNFGSLGTIFYQTVQEAGSALPQESALNFVNPVGVACSDNSAEKRTDCDIAYTELQVNTIEQPTHNRLNFLSGVACTSNDTNDSSDCAITSAPKLATTPTVCPSGEFSNGILPNGNTAGCQTPATANLPVTVVANLPSGAGIGQAVVVTDWNGVNGTCTGSGGNVVIALYNGTSWNCTLGNSSTSSGSSLIFSLSAPSTQSASYTPFSNTYVFPAGTFCTTAGTVYRVHFAEQTPNNLLATSFGIGATRFFTNYPDNEEGSTNGELAVDLNITCLSGGGTTATLAVSGLLTQTTGTSAGTA
ncbi:MAG: hypothetical protein ACRD22_15485, partial [Terriglobia bacterium]